MEHINAIPYAFIVLNCIGWVMYGLSTNNYFIFGANLIGLLSGLFFVTNAMSILANNTKCDEPLPDTYRMLETLLLVAFGFWSIMALVATFHSRDDSTAAPFRNQVLGTGVVVTNILYYAAPLSTLVKVIRTQDSSSIYFPMVLINLLNAAMWFLYGFALFDVNILIPNGLGILLAIAQGVILVIFRVKRRHSVDTVCTTVKHAAVIGRDIETGDVLWSDDGTLSLPLFDGSEEADHLDGKHSGSTASGGGGVAAAAGDGIEQHQEERHKTWYNYGVVFI